MFPRLSVLLVLLLMGARSWAADKLLPVSAPRPEYPYEARSRHITGDGICVLTVDRSSGAVTDATLRKSTGSSILDNAVSSALRQWRFEPGLRTKKIEVPVSFTMTGATVGDPVAVDSEIAKKHEPKPDPQSVVPSPAVPHQPSPGRSPTRFAKLTKPLKIKIAYGETTLPAGLQLPLASADGAALKVEYMGHEETIPAESAQIEEAPAAIQRLVLEKPAEAKPAREAPVEDASTLGLEAHEIGTADGTVNRWFTDWDTYSRDFRRQKRLLITVRDFSRKVSQVTVHVYFIGHPMERATPLFVYGHSAVPVELKGNLEVSGAVDAPPLPGHTLQIGTYHYVRGSDIDGWIVIGEAFAHPFQVRASRQGLLDLAERNPQQLEEMLKDYASKKGHH